MDRKDLPKCLRKWADRIDSISNEKAYGEGCWVYLNDRFFSEEMGCRTIHEDTWAECADLVAAAVTNEEATCTGAKS